MIDFSKMRMTRRDALSGVAMGTAGALAACSGAEPPLDPPPTGAFRHGVASGDPLTDRVILWTRLTTDADGAVDVEWTISRDREGADVAARGVAGAEPSRDWTVKVDAGGLEPGTDYFYSFRALGETSPAGRARTLPTGSVERFTMAVASCANYPAGYFNAYRDIAARGDVDLVLYLGDYFYEYGMGGYATDDAEKYGRVPDPAHEVVSLADYRRRHAQYKSDPDLQRAHAAAPWVVIWDDHETANDSWSGGAQNHQADEEGAWSARKRAAMRAYFEWMPVREPERGRAREALWRTFEIGDLASLIMLETRLTARSQPLNWSDFPIALDADPEDPDVRETMRRYVDAAVGAPEREMLGGVQAAFVAGALAASTAAGKPWQIFGNQVVMANMLAPNYIATLPGWMKWYVRRNIPEYWDEVLRTQFTVPISLDQWDGYAAARERLYASCRDAGANVITVTGDTHTFLANTLEDAAGARIGVEFGTSSISSPSEFNNAPPGVNFGRLTEDANPNIAFHGATQRGYTVLELTPETATADMVEISTVKRRAYSAGLLRRFRTSPAAGGGTTGLEEVGA